MNEHVEHSYTADDIQVLEGLEAVKHQSLKALLLKRQ